MHALVWGVCGVYCMCVVWVVWRVCVWSVLWVCVGGVDGGGGYGGVCIVEVSRGVCCVLCVLTRI